MILTVTTFGFGLLVGALYFRAIYKKELRNQEALEQSIERKVVLLRDAKAVILRQSNRINDLQSLQHHRLHDPELERLLDEEELIRAGVSSQEREVYFRLAKILNK